MVVDDEEMIRDIFREELESLGAKVSTAENGKIAAEMVKSGNFDLILSDFKMPVCNGLEMAIEIRKTHKTRPHVILCTAFSSDFTVEDRKNAGIIDLIEKPFDLTVVISTIEKFLAKP